MICLDNAKRRTIPFEHAARIQEDRICLDSMTIREARYDLS